MFSARLSTSRAHLSRCSYRQLTSQILSNSRPVTRNPLYQGCRRFYANPPSPQSEALAARQAARLASQKSAEANEKKKALTPPKPLLIFHAGTTRTTFLALLKLTSLLIGAFFVGIITPTYVRSDKSYKETAKVAFCGLVPPLLIAYLTAPFVTHMRVRLPHTALGSKASLEKFIHGGGIAQGTELEITTMSFIAKPRTSTVHVGELLPTKRRFGIVNYMRQDSPRLEEQRKARKWYQFRPVTNFYVQQGRPGQGRKVRYAQTTVRKDPVEWWVWESIQQRIASSASS